MSNLIVRIIAQNLTKAGFTSAAAGVKSFGAGVEAAAAKLLKLGAAGAVVGALSLKQFAAADKAVREIGTLLGDVTDKQLRTMGNELDRMSVKFGQSFEKMAKAKYDIVSAGFTDAADSATLLDQASRLAAAGVTEVSKTADVLTSVLNAYGSGVDRAAYVSDVLFTTVRLGKTTMDELTSGLGRATAMAPLVGVKFKELAAATSTLTASGQSTDQVVTALTQVMSSFLKPSKEMADKLKQIGVESGSALIKSKGFAEALRLVTENASEADIAAYFGNIRAFRAVAPLVSTAAATFANHLEQMGHVAGATDTAFDIMQKGISFKLDQLQQVAARSIRKIGAYAADAVLAFIDMEPAAKNAALAVGALAASFMLLGAPITLLAAAAYTIYKAWDTNFLGIRELVAYAAEDLMSYKNKIVIAFEGIVGIVRAALDMSSIGITANFAVMSVKLEEEMARHADAVVQVAADTANMVRGTWEELLPDFSSMLGLDDVGKIIENATGAVDVSQVALIDPLMQQQRMLTSGIKNEHDVRLGQQKLVDTKIVEGHKKALDDRLKLEDEYAKAAIITAYVVADSLISAFSAHTAAAKAGLIVQAIMDTYAGANRALGSLPPPFSFIAAAAVTAAGFANVRRISGMAGGGIVADKPVRAQTGMITAGFDAVPAILRRGEAVIPTEKTRDNLPAVRQLMSGQSLTQTSSGGGGRGVQMTFNISTIDSQGVEQFVRGNSFRDSLLDALSDERLNLQVAGVNVQGVR